MTGAGSDSCTVTLNAAAVSGGLQVSLASSNSAVVVPASVTVPAGANSADFTANVSPVTSVQASTITASAGWCGADFRPAVGRLSAHAQRQLVQLVLRQREREHSHHADV